VVDQPTVFVARRIPEEGRDAVRAAVVAPDGRILMLHYANEHDEWWIPPGGGVDPL